MRINYDFLDLEAFLAVLETGSFHGAAARLNMSQPSITRRVRKLEEALDRPLFERTTRAVRPTLAAKRLRMSAETMVAHAQETTRALRDDSQVDAYQRARMVTVATVPTVLTQLLTPALEQVGTRHPALRVRVLDLAANGVSEAVDQGEADLGISSVALPEPGLRFEHLLEDPIVLAVQASHPFVGRAQLSWSDLADQSVILPARGTGNRLLIDDALARVNQGAQWRFEVGRTSTALGLVADGAGVALVPKMAVQGMNSPAVRWCRIGSPQILRPLGLVCRAGDSLEGVAADLREALFSVSRSF